jgi:acyl-CoA synthetase (AMP-forming)/AMP-acid ligase II
MCVSFGILYPSPFTKWWNIGNAKGASQLQWVDELTTQANPDHRAMIDFDGVEHTYQALEGMVADLNTTLREHGVRAGDRVMVVSENCAMFAVAILALSRLRAWITPVNARQTIEEIRAIRDHSGARCVIFTTEASASAAQHAAQYDASVLGRLDCGDICVSPAFDATPEKVDTDPARQVAALMYTTGTTSAPKGVMLTHANLVWNAKTSSSIRNLGVEDVVLVVLPATHIYCFASGILAALCAGATIRFIPRFTPEIVLAAFADGATMMPGVPQMYQAIVNHLHSLGKPPDAPKLRLISSGGAPLDPDWKKGIEAFFGLPLHNGYGLTETSPGVAVTRDENPHDDISVGEVVPDVEIHIENPDGDGIGELLIRGPNIMKGYYHNPKATTEAIRPDGYFVSGDLARVGSKGELYIVGRKKELIIRSGFNVYPPEVEAMLTRHPEILQAAVVGRSVSGNEEVLAFLLTSGNITEAEAKEWLRNHLVAYKIPQHVFIVDSFPTAPTGKILKHKIVDAFADKIADADAAAKIK